MQKTIAQRREYHRAYYAKRRAAGYRRKRKYQPLYHQDYDLWNVYTNKEFIKPS